MFDLVAGLTIEDFKDKVVFWDIDGVLAPYRFNGHLGVLGSNDGMTQKEIDSGIFLERSPSKYMKIIVNSCKARRHVVCSHVICHKELVDKNLWLDRHYSCIKERIFLDVEKSKAEAIIRYCRFNDILLRDVYFIDDRLDILREAERKGISAWHISSLLDVLC